MSSSSIITRTIPYLPFLFLACISQAWSESQRDLDSHEHGASLLNIVIDENKVFIELESPWENLVGFEHQPATQSQLTAMSEALKFLAEPSLFLSFNTSASCLGESAEISSTVEATLSSAQPQEEEDRHAEVVASYTFECAQPSSLEQLSVNLFDFYEGVEDIDVQLAGPSGQAGFELTPGATTVDLAAVR